MFLMKYDPNGVFQWVRTGGGPGREEGLAVTCDAAGDIYVCGMHHDAAVFGSYTLNSPLGNYNMFLAKYNSAGTLIWIENPGSDYDDLAFGLTTDNAGKIYMTGEFTGYCIFDSHALVNSSMLSDGFVACYDASGNAQWVTQISGTLADRPRAIASDGINTFITGQFGGTSVFGTTTLIAADSSDIFIAGLNSSGNFTWAKSVGGAADSLETLGYESGNAISAVASGSVYATGATLNGGIFGSDNLTQYGRTDMFITKINQAGVGVDENEEQFISLYPNPNNGSFTLDLSSLKCSENVVEVYNFLGQVVNSQNCAASRIDLTLADKGIYFVKVMSGSETYLTRVVVQ